MSANRLQETQTQAIITMIVAIFCFTIMDLGAKILTSYVGVIPTLWARYTGQMAVVFIIVLPRLKTVTRTNYPFLQFLRSIVLAGATGCMFLAISRIPLNEAAALMSVNPVLITLGAALFLGEKLGIRRIVGIGLAFLGALTILRPASDVFNVDGLYAIAGAVCYSTYALLTRRVGSDEDIWTSLFYTGLIGSVVLSVLAPFAWITPNATAILFMFVVAAFGTLGQLFLIRAFSRGEAAMLAPYSYTGLIFATLWGIIFFAEFPDFWTVLGTLVIAAAGIYVWHRETFHN